MSELHLPERWLNTVRQLLASHVPKAEVWAYGSRVDGRSHEGSDLDLILRGMGGEAVSLIERSRLAQAFEDSDLPISVDVQDWRTVPSSFHASVERSHVIIQAAPAVQKELMK